MKRRYRQNVAIVMVNARGLILVGERSDRSGAWQLPQGGIEQGEDAEQAMWRELGEEVGDIRATLIGQLPETITYDWPPELYDRGFHGQEQRYFLLRINPDEEGRVLSLRSEEFQNFNWVQQAEFFALASGFKVAAYRIAIRRLIELYPDTIT